MGVRAKKSSPYQRSDYHLELLESRVHLSAAPIAVTLALTNSKSPIPGDPITINAKVTPVHTIGAVTGIITFSGNGQVLGTANVKSGKASFTFTFPRFGNDDITAEFDPTTNYTTSDADLPLQVQTQFIDIMGLYSVQEGQSLGSAAILSHLDAHIAAANEAFVNSGIPIVLRLVGLLASGYSESGNLNTDLNELAFNSEVATARNRFGADLVVLMDASGSQMDATVGIATLLNNPASSDRSHDAFIVLDDAEPADSDVLAHEVGHTLGAGHAVGDPQSSGSTRYAHGYRFVGDDGQTYHDIMAYAPGIQIPYFSNPGITYQGQPEGNAATADTSRVLSENAHVVAAYRAAKPIGAIDSASITTLTGNAFDPRSPDPLTLRVDIDNVTRTTFLADEPRDSLTAQFGVPVHGFTYTLPRLTQGSHSVKIYAIDPFTGAAVLIASKTISAPSPFYDETYYLVNNPDVVTLIADGKYKNGWDEFQKVGQYQGRDPSPYFNTQYYLDQNPDLATLSAAGKLRSPYADYVSKGQYKHRAASPLFDEAYYLEANPDLALTIPRPYKSAILEYLLVGSYLGRVAEPPAG